MSWKQKETNWCWSCYCDIPTGPLFRSFFDFTLWYQKKQTEQNAIGKMQEMVHFTPLQRLLPISCRDFVHCLLCVPKIFHKLFILLQFLIFQGLKLTQTWKETTIQKNILLVLKRVEVTAVDELNTNGVKSITVQRSKITYNSFVQLMLQHCNVQKTQLEQRFPFSLLLINSTSYRNNVFSVIMMEIKVLV